MTILKIFDELFKLPPRQPPKFLCSLELYNYLNKKQMDEQLLKRANLLSRQIELMKHFISRVENENYRMFVNFNDQPMERAGLDFNEFLPNEGKARCEYLKSLRVKLGKLEKEFASL